MESGRRKAGGSCQNLRICGLRHEDLLKAINACNEEIEKYKQRIREINSAMKSR